MKSFLRANFLPMATFLGIASQGISKEHLNHCSHLKSRYVPDGLHCTWSDEFGGIEGQGQPQQELNRQNWSYEFIVVNNEQQVYTKKDCLKNPRQWNTCVSDGKLTIKGRPLEKPMTCPGDPDCAPSYRNHGNRTASYSSARITSKTKMEWQYGYLEFRVRLPDQNRSPQAGSWPAIWTLQNQIQEGPGTGAKPWPVKGAHEFDILEWTARYHFIESNAIWEPTHLKTDLGYNTCNFWPEGGHPACLGPEKIRRDKNCTGVFDKTPYPDTLGTTHHDANSWIWQRNMVWHQSPEPHNGEIFGCHGTSTFDHNGWYIYGYLWNKDAIQVFVNGELKHSLDIKQQGLEGWHQFKQFLIINMAYGGDLGCKFYHNIDNSDPAACLKQIKDWSTQTLEIDYIRLYQ